MKNQIKRLIALIVLFTTLWAILSTGWLQISVTSAIAEVEVEAEDLELEESPREMINLLGSYLNVEPLSVDHSADLEIKQLELQHFLEGNWHVVQNGDQLKMGGQVQLAIDWEMTTVGIKKDDFFQLLLPDYFDFSTVNKQSLEIDADGTLMTIGTYEIVPFDDSRQMIKVVFNDKIAINDIDRITKGRFKFHAFTLREKQLSEEIKLGTVSLVPFEIVEDSTITGPAPFYTTGRQGIGDENTMIRWSVGIRVNDLIDIMRGKHTKGFSNPYDKGIYENTLAEGLSLEEVEIRVPIFKVNEDGTINDLQATRFLINTIDKTTDFENDAALTDLTAWRNRLQKEPAGTCAVYTDLNGVQTYLLKFGTIPNDTMSEAMPISQTLASRQKLINNATNLTSLEKAKTLIALDNLNTVTNGTMLGGFTLTLKASVISPGVDTQYKNRGKIYYGENNERLSQAVVAYKKVGGGAEGTVHKSSIRIKKRDSQTGMAMKDIEFLVYKAPYQPSDSPLPVRKGTTNSEGVVELKNLAVGKYVLVETYPEGYEHNMIIIQNDHALDPNGSFEITGNETKGFDFEIENRPASVEISLRASKQLSGASLEGGDFHFNLTQGTKTLQSKSNQKNGDIIFDPISFKAPGLYKFEINEKIPAIDQQRPGIIYDTRKVQVEVQVSYSISGQLEAIVNYDGKPEVPNFSNSYAPTAAKLTLRVKTLLQGRSLKKSEFGVELKKGENLIQTKRNELDGSVNFDALVFDQAGEYVYQLREIIGTEKKIKYDKKTINMVVSVEDIDGKLVAKADYQDPDDTQATAAIFQNEYNESKSPVPISVQLRGKKQLIGRALQAGEFEFILYNDQQQEIQRVTNQKNGDIIFDSLIFDSEGHQTFYLEEVKGSTQGVTYDDKKIKILVEVSKKSDSLQAKINYSSTRFINIFEEERPELPNSSGKTITIKKVDRDTGQLLKGAVFDIYDSQGKKIKKALVTDDNGEVKIQGLSPGRYQAVETKAPKRYQVESEPIFFTVK